MLFSYLTFAIVSALHHNFIRQKIINMLPTYQCFPSMKSSLQISYVRIDFKNNDVLSLIAENPQQLLRTKH